MPRKGENPGQAIWLKAVTVGLVAAAMSTATSSGSHGANVATSDPPGCVMVKLA